MRQNRQPLYGFEIQETFFNKMSAVTLSLKILILNSLSRFLNFKCRFRTDFQARVYAALLEVPAGRVITYGDLAAAIGCRSPRAVGQALRRNPFAPVVPCHRVVAAGGRLGGFQGRRDGAALSRKRALLAAEGVLFRNGRLVEPQRLWRFREGGCARSVRPVRSVRSRLLRK